MRPTGQGERGSSVLETAIAIPSLIAVAFVLLWALMVGTTSIQMAATAQDLARGLARGEAANALIDRALASMPGSTVQIDDQGGLVAVTVQREVLGSAPLLGERSLRLEQRAVAPREWAGP